MAGTAGSGDAFDSQVEALEQRSLQELRAIREKRLVTYQVTLLIALLYYVVSSLHLRSFAVTGSLILVAAIVGGSIWVLRKTKCFAWSSAIYMFALFLSVISGAARSGCVDSPAIWSLSILPVVATCLYDSRGTIVCCALTLASLGLLWGLGEIESFAQSSVEVTLSQSMVLCLVMVASIALSTYMTASVSNQRMVQLHRQLEQSASAHSESQASNRAKSEFLARMSHELRTPMNGLLGVTQHLLASPLSPKETQALDIVQRCAENLLTMLNDALDLTKVDASEIAIAKVPVDVALLIQDVHSLFLAKAKLDGIDLVLDVQQSPMWSRTDPTRLRQVVSNLVGNALRYSDKGQVTMSLRTTSAVGDSPSQLLIAIADQGIGMNEEQIARLFQDFEQVHALDGVSRGGTGLGLAISKRLVTMLGGTIEVQSSPQVGSVFTVRLPNEAVVPQAQIPCQGQVNSFTPSLSGLRALVVDDGPINLKVATLALSKLGLDCDTALDGARAVDKVRSEAFDVVFMDLRMPVMDGLCATREIRAQESGSTRLAIVGLTANAYAEDKAAALEAGMDAYISKPFKVSDLQSVLIDLFHARDLSDHGELEGRVIQNAS